MAEQLHLWKDITISYSISGNFLIKKYQRVDDKQHTICTVKSYGAIHLNETVRKNGKLKSSYFQEDKAHGGAWEPSNCTMAVESPPGVVIEMGYDEAKGQGIIDDSTKSGEGNLMTVTDGVDGNYSVKSPAIITDSPLAGSICDNDADAIVYQFLVTHISTVPAALR